MFEANNFNCCCCCFLFFVFVFVVVFLCSRPESMENMSHRAVIRYLCLNDLTPKEFNEDMVVILGDNAPSYNMVK